MIQTVDLKKVAVVMITKNEEQAVGLVINEIKALSSDIEIIIVDSSEDKTANIAQSLGATVIRQYPPKGYGPAMDRALHASKRDVIITMDCDGTYPVLKIPELASLVLNENYDLADASRLEKKPQAMPWINYFANYFFAFFASLLFFKRLTDLHSGMRAYRRDMIEQLTYNAKGAALPVELLLRPLKRGFKLKVIFIEYKERIGASTMRPLESAWWTLKRILSVRFT